MVKRAWPRQAAAPSFRKVTANPAPSAGASIARRYLFRWLDAEGRGPRAVPLAAEPGRSRVDKTIPGLEHTRSILTVGSPLAPMVSADAPHRVSSSPPSTPSV